MVKTGGNDDTRLKSTIRAEIHELTQHKLNSMSPVDSKLRKMKMLIVTLLGYSIVATLTIIALGSLLSKCRSSSSYDTILGDKSAVEKEEYGLLIMDGSQEGECNCNTGFMAMSWTILEVLVTGILAAVAIMMAVKGVIRTISLLKEKKQKRLIEKQKQEDETREQIRLEERNKLETIETS